MGINITLRTFIIVGVVFSIIGCERRQGSSERYRPPKPIFPSLQHAVKDSLNIYELDLTFELIGERIDTLPPEIFKLKNLKRLSVGNHGIKFIPPEIGQLLHLEELRLGGNPINKLPSEIGQLKKLKILSLGAGIFIDSIPRSFQNLTNLEYLDVESCRKISNLSEGLCYFKNLRELVARNTGLKEIPSCLYEAVNLESLYLDYNDIQQISEDIKKLKKLKELYLIDNPIISISSGISNLRELELIYVNKAPLTLKQQLGEILPTVEIK